jgi:hypothetical protein
MLQSLVLRLRSNMKTKIGLSGKILSAAIACSILTSVFSGPVALAAQITTRSLQLVAGVEDGGSMPGGVVNHFFTFTLPTTGNVGSIKFEYCTIAAGTCTMPTGLVTTSATLDSQTGATGFTAVNTTNGAPYITRVAAPVTGPQIVTYRLNTITNPTAVAPDNQTFYVRITTYDDADLAGNIVDTGVVAATTATQIVLTGIMPESLIFCTGGTIDKTGGVPDCTTATSGAVSFNQLFSPTDTATASSQMVASTNASGGYSISVNGATMTSGSNTVAAMAARSVGVRGIGQFGLNLRLNTVATSTIAVGADIDAPSNGTDLRGQPSADYGVVDEFKFADGDVVARSDSGGAGPTNSQIFTVSYIVNVPGSQAAGTYTTTLTYICTATY